MQTTLVTPPAAEPVTLEELKSALRVTHNHEDSYLNLLNRAARVLCERAARFWFVSQTWKMRFTSPNPSKCYDPDDILNGIQLLRNPIASITSLSQISSAGVPTVIDTSLWFWNDRNLITYFPEYIHGGANVEVVYEVGKPLEVFQAQHPDLCWAIIETARAAYDMQESAVKDVPPAVVPILNGYWSSPLS